MKLKSNEMTLFPVDYGDLIRPPYRIVRGSGWAQCSNRTKEFVIVYGPKHAEEASVFDTSPYVLPPDATSPDRWDCKGFLLPADRLLALKWQRTRKGPLVIKFWNCRRFSVESVEPDAYRCSWNNGVFEPSQINWAIPNFTYPEIARRVGLISASR